jgi:hypothetical protein
MKPLKGDSGLSVKHQIHLDVFHEGRIFKGFSKWDFEDGPQGTPIKDRFGNVH